MVALSIAGSMVVACSSGASPETEAVTSPATFEDASATGSDVDGAKTVAASESTETDLIVVDGQAGTGRSTTSDESTAASSEPPPADTDSGQSTSNSSTQPNSAGPSEPSTVASNPPTDVDPTTTVSVTTASPTTAPPTTAPTATITAAPSSTPVLPAGSGPFAGLPFSSGEIVAADYASSPDAMSIWSYVTNGYHASNAPYDYGSDTQIVHRGNGGDSVPAMDGRVHNGYRRLHTFGPQSLWDAENQPNHTRSQLGGWGESSSFHLFQKGQRTFVVFSVRLDSDTAIKSTVVGRRGLAHLSMVSQFKSVLPGSSNPMISIEEGRDGLRLKYRGNGFTHEEVVTNLPRGAWLRLGIDVLWAEEGALRWWGDLDGDRERNFVPLSPRVEASTILPGYNAAAFNIGPYHMHSVPENGRDYSNVEVVVHPADDPW